MKTNSLSLSFRQVAATDKSPAFLVAELRVDGARLGQGYVVDIRRLAEALTKEWEHFIFTCGCGDAGCAGIFDGVLSRISRDQVTLAGSLPKGGPFLCPVGLTGPQGLGGRPGRGSAPGCGLGRRGRLPHWP